MPLRCLIPQGSQNLIAAGRCLSADGSGFGSVRVMATCMAMGQGAGTAAALCVQHGYSISEINFELLRETLIQQAPSSITTMANPGHAIEIVDYPLAEAATPHQATSL